MSRRHTKSFSNTTSAVKAAQERKLEIKKKKYEDDLKEANRRGISILELHQMRAAGFAHLTRMSQWFGGGRALRGPDPYNFLGRR